MGDGYRWLTVIHPDRPELQVVLSKPGPPLEEESAESVRCLLANGDLHAVGLATDDCRKTHQELVAKGVEFTQEPADRPYGVEAVLRDPSGNLLVLVEQKAWKPEDFEGVTAG